MNPNIQETATPTINAEDPNAGKPATLVIPAPQKVTEVPTANGLLTTSKVAANGSTTFTAKQMTRKEYAEANKLDTKAADFSAKYRGYLYSHNAQGNVALAAVQQAGLTFKSVKIRTKKDGTAASATISFGAVPADKAPKADVAKLVENCDAFQKQLAEMKEQMAALQKERDDARLLAEAAMQPPATGKPRRN